MTSRVNGPITVAIVDDYDVVVMGLANMFDQYSDRVVVAELDSNEALVDTVDIALYVSFAQPESDHEEIAVLVANLRARRVVVYTWNFHPDLIHECAAAGSARLPVEDIARARVGHRTGGSACR
jgi:DNA-binding NarL/FixJ family response regulator